MVDCLNEICVCHADKLVRHKNQCSIVISTWRKLRGEIFASNKTLAIITIPRNAESCFSAVKLTVPV